MIILPANSLTGGFEVANSCRFNAPDDPNMNKSLGTPTNTKIFTVSAWVKSISDASTDTSLAAGYVGTSDRWNFQFGAGKIQLTGSDIDLATTQLFRDPSAWWHIVVAVDTSQGVASNRVKLYINGTQVTSFSSSTYPTQDMVPPFCDSSGTIYVGEGTNASGVLSKPFDGYIAEFCFVDGQQLAPTSFGEFDEDSPTIFKPIDVSGLTFGNNGFYLDFEDSSNLGNDANGGTDLTEVNLAATDSSTDTPTNNFCVMNPLEKHASTTLKEGNLDLSTTASGWHGASTTMGITLGSGPWYFEAKAISSARLYFGLSRIGQGVRGITYANSTEGDADFDYMWRVTSANTVYYGGADQSITITAISANDICACHVATDGEVKFYKNDSLVVTFSTKLVTGYTYFPILSANAFGGGTESWQANFGTPPYANSSSNTDPDGYGAFEYATKSGYALCTKNLGAYGG